MIRGSFKGRRYTRGARILALVAATVSLTLVMTTASPAASQPVATSHAAASSHAAAAYRDAWVAGKVACYSTDKFDGSKATMEHFLNCKHFPYNTYCHGCTSAVHHDGYGHVTTLTPASKRAGGPPCSWIAYHIAKYCYGQDVHHHWIAHLMCVKWWYDHPEAYYCQQSEAWSLINAQGLRDWSEQFPHAAHACLAGASFGGVAAIVVSLAGGPLGWIAGSTIGCIGGVLDYYFRPGGR